MQRTNILGWGTLVGACAFVALALTARAGSSSQHTAPSPAPATPGPIAVGENLLVSAAHPQWHHDEVILSIDPTDSNRMLACGIVLIPETAQRTDIIYASHDRGKTWTPTLVVPGQSSDPTCQFGTDGTAYFSIEGLVPDALDMYVSRDHGQSWSLGHHTSLAIVGYDRQFFAVDDTPGKYHGRVYVDAWTYVRTLDAEDRPSTFEGMTLYYTPDNGHTWSDMMRRLSRGWDVRVDLPGNCDVFSDGSLACIYVQQTKHPEWIHNDVHAIRVMTTPAGGSMFSTQLTVATDVNIAECPHLAIDRFTSQFKNRVYAVWSAQAGTKDIWSAYSDDRGRTWSKPIMVNDDHWDPSADLGDHDVPQVAVNRNGIVGVTWYDHREDPKGQTYRARFSASLDGGETFLPSVPVASAPHTLGHDEHWGPTVMGDSTFENDGYYSSPKPSYPISSTIGLDYGAGDTAGLVADQAGTFWDLWTDNRTSYDQMYIAPVNVAGRPARHGSADLASLDDISDKIFMNYSAIEIDASHTTASTNVQLKNRSNLTFTGPLRGRILALSSNAGTPSVANADNGEQRLGAVWQFLLQPGQRVLRPGEVTQSRKLTFNLADPVPYYKAGHFATNVVTFDLQILGKAERRLR